MAVSESIAYMDRRLSSLSSSVVQSYNAGTDTMTWTLPYSVPVDGSEGTLVAALADVEFVLSTSRPSGTQISCSGQGDLTTREVFFGVLYKPMYAPSRIYARDRNGVPDETNKLTIRRVKVFYQQTTMIAADIYRQPGKWGHQEQSFDLPTDSALDISIHAVNDKFRVEISSTDTGPFALTGMVWEGDIHPRAQKV